MIIFVDIKAALQGVARSSADVVTTARFLLRPAATALRSQRVSVLMRRSARRPLEGGQTLTLGQSRKPYLTQMGNISGQTASGQTIASIIF